MDLIRILAFPVIVVALGGASFIATTSLGPKIPKSYIDVSGAPADSTVSIDGQPASFGRNTVIPGDHTVAISKDGFDTAKQPVKTVSAQAVKVGLSLTPSSGKTRDWYDKHPDDAKLAETISSHQFDYQNSVNAQKNSLLQQLPVIYGDGHGGNIRLDSGNPLTQFGPPAVYVTANTPEDRQDVLTWLHTHGYEPSSMDLVFYSEQSTLTPETGE